MLMPLEDRIVGFLAYKVIPVTLDDLLAMGSHHINRDISVRAFANQVTQAIDGFDSALFDILQNGLKGRDVSVYVGDQCNLRQ
jgi:hypothetical protein